MVDDYKEDFENELPQQRRPPGIIFFLPPGYVSLLHFPAPCRSWKDVPIDGYFAEDKQSNLDPNDVFLTRTIWRVITTTVPVTR